MCFAIVFMVCQDMSDDDMFTTVKFNCMVGCKVPINPITPFTVTPYRLEG